MLIFVFEICFYASAFDMKCEHDAGVRKDRRFEPRSMELLMKMHFVRTIAYLFVIMYIIIFKTFKQW